MGLVLLASTQLCAQVTVQVSRNVIMQNETFTVKFQAQGEVGKNLTEPNWSVLEQSFQILGNRQAYSFQSVNGKTQATTSWELEMLPKRNGNLKIPSLSFGSVQSPAKVIVVKKPSPQKTRSKGDIYLEATATPLNPYVQQQVVYVFRVFMAKNLRGNISQPNFSSNVISKPLPERRYRINQAGKNYEVYERTYMLYPQKSGAVTIHPVTLTGHYIERNRRFAVNKRSPGVKLQVRPIPAGFNGKVWLPSPRLVLQQVWSGDLNNWEQGQALTRTLKLTGQQLLAQQLPKIELQAGEAFNVYTEDNASLNNRKVKDGFNGILSQQFVLIPTQSGKQQLPPVKVRWWNTSTDRQETAVLPAQTVTILAAPVSQLAMSNFTPGFESPATQESRQGHSVWLWVSVGLLLVWLFTLGFVVKAPVQRFVLELRHKKSHQAQLKALQAQIKQANEERNPTRMRNAIMQWARQFWAQDPPYTFAGIKARCTPGLRVRLEKFENAVYAQQAGAWNGESLYQAILHEPVKTSTRDEPRAATTRLEPMHKV